MAVWRRAAQIAAIAGAGGSELLMLIVGRGQRSLLLLVLFAIWVPAPFVAVGLANMFSERWPPLTRRVLYGMTLIFAVFSLAGYADVVLRPPRSTAAFRFVVFPLAEWLLLVAILPLFAYEKGRHTKGRHSPP
jgi:hypothetical protein